jgi:hypothetical protein
MPPRAEGRGTRALAPSTFRPLLADQPRALPFPSWDLSEKHFAADPNKPRFSNFVRDSPAKKEGKEVLFQVCSDRCGDELAVEMNNEMKSCA